MFIVKRLLKAVNVNFKSWPPRILPSPLWRERERERRGRGRGRRRRGEVYSNRISNFA